MHTRNGKADVTVERRVSGEAVYKKEGERRLSEVNIMADKAAEVNVRLGYTKNLTNYESLRVDVGVTLPCEPDEVREKIPQAKALAEGFLHKFLKEAMEDKS